MAKGKQKGAATAAPPKCSCDDPYKCSCGNRPERPSRGHKWYPEEQIWAGKGHKQKGASGQIATVSEKAKVTETGKTQVAQWQQLPSQLLGEYCRGQKRPSPKFKNMGTDGLYKFRCIVPDSKDTHKDLFFIPAHAVGNEEQAKEESALLAMLQLTPNLPHERKLPEPYRTTWLNAILSLKEEAASKKAPLKKDPAHLSGCSETNKSSAKPSNQNATLQSLKKSDVAVASTQLTLGTSYISQADQRQKLAELRRRRNAQIRKHENLRIANQNHPVFMSASIRHQIEQLLRGEALLPELDAVSDEEDIKFDDEGDNDVKAYVMHRLHSEGFAKRQAMNAYNQVVLKSIVEKDYVDEDDGWDRAYEACLQWLLVNLNEEQLPEGFDPRGGTLDVVIHGKSTSESSTINAVSSGSDSSIFFSLQYGVTAQEAFSIHTKALQLRKEPVEVFWNVVHVAAGLLTDNDFLNRADESHATGNKELFNDELETLRAIFDSDLTETDELGCSVVCIALEDHFNLVVSVPDGFYPSARPTYVAVSGKWEAKVGATLHIELAKIVYSLPLKEPMIFAIHSSVQDLLHSVRELAPFSLLPVLGVKENLNQPDFTPICKKVDVNSKGNLSTNSTKSYRRTHEKRKSFWTILPSDVPPAVPFPQISVVIERARKSLPAAASREEFLGGMKEAKRLGIRVVLVTGETGSGKSTQLPAYLLEDDPVGSKIVVVQPRRIAATGVANRVAEERGEKQPGVDSVGYVVRGDTAICNRSRLLFCTTGVLLRQLQNEGALECISTIIVDEVHERSLDIDVLLGLLKKMLPSTPHLQVVLMSATVDAERFKTYWGDTPVPHIHIPGRTFSVSDYLLEDVFRFTGYVRSNKKKKPSTRNSTEKGEDPIPKDIDDFEERDLVCQLIKYIVSNKNPSDDGSILVFLAGAPEIKKMEDAIKAEVTGLSLMILSLHGGLQPKEQARVFQSAKKGFTKVVLATNIAETSVTIPDCTVVIDTGREKQASYDPANRMPLLVEQFASKASLKQRRGRAGRVREGTCYKLISRTTFDTLKEHSEPEIQRVALDQTLLQLIYIGVEPRIGLFTNTLLDPPNKGSLEAAIFSLRKIGAVERGPNDEVVATPLGAHLASIPAPPLVGKLLVMGSILGCRSAALAMAAGICLGRSFYIRVDNGGKSFVASTSFDDIVRRRVLEQRAIFAKESGNSDHALAAFVFLKWQQTEKELRSRFCESLGVNSSALYDMALLFNQLDVSLGEAGFTSSQESDRYASSWRIIQACAVSAMSPNQLVKVRRPVIKYHETAEGAKQKDGVARELSFFIRADSEKEERVFIHPSSINFSTGNYSCPVLVYNSMVRTTKPYLRDVTECSAYSLLLFGGELEVQASKGVVVVDRWIELAANARIGSLVGGLRRTIDSLLAEKIVNPTIDLTTYPEMKLVIKLIRTDGLGS